LEFLHYKGIAHRDIKPENLLLDSRLNLIIADFGSAAYYFDEKNKVLKFNSGEIVGSQEYNAPEINTDKYYRGDKADLFSSTICLFVMVMGCSPFRAAVGCDPYFKLLARKDKSAYWAIYSDFSVSPEFKDLFEKLTERNAEKRLSIPEIRNHPWMKGEIPNPGEVLEQLINQLEHTERACKQGLEEFKFDSELTITLPQCEIFKTIDPRLLSECLEINSFLEKQRNSQHIDDNPFEFP